MKRVGVRSAFLALLWALLTISSVEGQPVSQHRFGVGIGLGHDAQKDELVSPLLYTGLMVPLHLEYSFRGRNNRHAIEVDFGASTLSSAISKGIAHTQDFFLVDVHAGYERNLRSSTSWGMWLGIESEHHYAFREHHYTPGIREYAGIYYSSVGPALTLTRRIRGTDVLGLHAALSVAAFMIRPPYSLKGKWEPDLVFLNEFAGVSSNIYYTYDLSSALALRARYGFSFCRTEIPFRMVDVQNRLGVVVLLKR